MCNIDRSKIDLLKQSIRRDKVIVIVLAIILFFLGLLWVFDSFGLYTGILPANLSIDKTPAVIIFLSGLLLLFLTPRTASTDIEECEILLAKYHERKDETDEVDEICDKYLAFRRQFLLIRIIGNVREILPRVTFKKKGD